MLSNFDRNEPDFSTFPISSLSYADDAAPPGANILVIGVGGAGGNTINRMIEAGVHSVQYLAVNTDQQALGRSLASRKLQIGNRLTKGLGAGGDPRVGFEAARESIDSLIDAIGEPDLVFVTAGLGGGTGTGAAPVIAGIAREMGALTISVSSTPFEFEGRVRQRNAQWGFEHLSRASDTHITIGNQLLLSLMDRLSALTDMFNVADETLKQGIQGISDVITVPGLVNLDFADVRTTMDGKGAATLGIGMGSGENRALDAARQALSSPLVMNTRIADARDVLINITAGNDISLFEVNEAANFIAAQVDPDANILVGTVEDSGMAGKIRVTAILTGWERQVAAQSLDREKKRWAA